VRLPLRPLDRRDNHRETVAPVPTVPGNEPTAFAVPVLAMVQLASMRLWMRANGVEAIRK